MNWINKFLTIFTILFSIGNAQVLYDYGIKIGMVSSKHEMDRNNCNDVNLILNYYNKSRTGPNGGIYIRYLNMNHFNIETELTYVQKGALQREIFKDKIPRELILNYVQLKNSLVPKMEINNFEIYSILGFSIDYMLSVKGGNLAHSKYKKYVLGYILGIGFKTGIFFNNKIFLELVLNKDINEVYENRCARYYNGLVALNVGLSFKNIL